MQRLSRGVLVAAVWLLSAWVSGCGVNVVLTKRPGSAPVSVSEASHARCDEVRVLRGRAPHDWEIVGVIDLAAFSVRALPRDDEAFLELVGPAVCQAGGDAVIAGVNGDGRYVLGTVIAWVEPTESAEPADDSQAGSGAGAAPTMAPVETPSSERITHRTAGRVCPEGEAC